jgi:hypothetical protein
MKPLHMPRYSRKETPENWLQTFQATAKVEGWTTDEDKLTVIPMFFKSKVRDWFYDGEYKEFKDFRGIHGTIWTENKKNRSL